MLRRVLARGATPKVGSVLADKALPPHSSVEELAKLAGNHAAKEGKQRVSHRFETKYNFGISFGFELDVSKFGNAALQNQPRYQNSNFLGQ